MSHTFRHIFGKKTHSQPAPASSSTAVAPSNHATSSAQPLAATHSSQATDGPAVTPQDSEVSSRTIEKGPNYGIRVLYDGGPEACADVVFVHGLTGNAYDTWLHKETGIHWPGDLLRQDIPDIRVLSFGFDADVVHFFSKGPASNSRLTNHAESLVGKLVRERERSKTESRKIIFVAHSLGGLVTEQALTHSKNSAEPHLNQVERDTIGIVFLGVPHCGSDLEAWATIGRRMVGILKRTNKDILDVLNPHSEMLHLVENNFHINLRQRKDNPIKITVFYEERAVQGIGEIVPQSSAKIPGYSFEGIHADHQNMTKFPSRRDPGYESIMGELQRWVRSIRSAKQESSQTDNYKPSEEEYKCLQSFCPIGDGYQSQKDQNPKHVSGTCLWTLENPKYLEWRENNTKKLIWISADPGCGKSVLAKRIVDEDLPNTSVANSPRHVYYYFFKDTIPEQRSASRALCAVLHQLFKSHPHLIHYALPKYRERGAALSTTLEELCSIFIAATADPTAGNTICVLDALDECDDQERSKLMERLENFCLDRGASPSTSTLKFLVTSRPYFEIRRGFDRLLEASNNIELAGNHESETIKKEIDLVIEHKVATLKHEKRLSQEVTDHLKKRLSEIEHRTYLWLYLLWEIIQKTLSGTKSAMDRLIDNLPSNIQEAYEVLLQRCPDHDFSKKALQIVLAAARPLTLDEIDVALHIDRQTLSYTTLDREGTDWLRDTLPSRCGLMVSVIGDKVYFIHQTVKEFLLRKAGAQRPVGRVWQQSLDLEESHGVLAEACFRCLSFPEIRLDQTNGFTGLLPEGLRDTVANKYCQRYSFLSYSAVYWAEHSRSPNNHERMRFMEIALEIFDQSSVIGEGGTNFGTVLHAASAGGHQDIVQMLLDRGADVNAQARYFGTALLAASSYGHQNVVQILLDRGADINVQTGFYGTALVAASSEGYKGIVQILLVKEANINARDISGRSALISALSKGYKDIVQMLLENGSNPNSQDEEGNSALSIVASYKYPNIARMLLENGADPNGRNQFGKSALFLASSEGYTEIVRILLEKGADPNEQHGRGNGALFIASSKGYKDIVRLLVEQGADLNAGIKYLGRALRVAVQEGHQDIVQILLEKGADPNGRDRYGDSVLSEASSGGYKDIVRLLVEKGANPNARGRYRDSALRVATREGHQDILQLLLDYGAKPLSEESPLDEGDPADSDSDSANESDDGDYGDVLKANELNALNGVILQAPREARR